MHSAQTHKQSDRTGAAGPCCTPPQALHTSSRRAPVSPKLPRMPTCRQLRLSSGLMVCCRW
jgi:hypothetical protein